jgi:hypothetical protein
MPSRPRHSDRNHFAGNKEHLRAILPVTCQ